MNQKTEELLIELSMLNDDLCDIQNTINGKREELRSVCTHDEVRKTIINRYDPKLNPVENYSHIMYRCLLCYKEMFYQKENQELEDRVIYDK